MASLIGGLVALFLGLGLLIIWRWSFLEVVMGTLPILLILGGALAAYLGYEEVKDKTASGSSNDEAASLKNEVESLKEEIRELKGEKAKSEEAK
jgi:cell division protein FtsB